MQYRIGKFDLTLPRDHPLPRYQELAPLYDKGWLSVAANVINDCPDGLVIDVGANIGDTAAALTTVADKPPIIICVEGADHFIPYLQLNAKRLGPQIRVINKFLWADDIAPELLTYPAPDPSRTVSLKSVLGTVPGRSISLFKSDTDGHDVLLLLQNWKLLQSQEAVLFFEYDPVVTALPLCNQLIQRLQDEKYAIIIFDNHGGRMLHLEHDYVEVLNDLNRWIRKQSKVGHRLVYYLDIWAFPPKKKALFLRAKGLTDEITNEVEQKQVGSAS